MSPLKGTLNIQSKFTSPAFVLLLCGCEGLLKKKATFITKTKQMIFFNPVMAQYSPIQRLQANMERDRKDQAEKHTEKTDK